MNLVPFEPVGSPNQSTWAIEPKLHREKIGAGR